MRLRRVVSRKNVSIVLVTLMMFSQTVYAFDACLRVGAPNAQAAAIMASVDGMSEMSGCEQMRMKAGPSCLAQCNLDSQISGHTLVEIPAISQVAILTVALPSDAVIAPALRSSPACGPPPPIRFCRFLI